MVTDSTTADGTDHQPVDEEEEEEDIFEDAQTSYTS